jgi:hypothetical protein
MPLHDLEEYMSEQIDHRCIVPGCPATGRNQLGVRCRIAHSEESPFPEKSRTHALFSVESGAYLCDHHALAGVDLTLVVAPTAGREAELNVVCGQGLSEPRSTPIKQPLREAA